MHHEASDSSGRIRLLAPDHVRPWERVEVSITIRNEGRIPLLPVRVRLTSGADVIAAWGIAERSTRWGVGVPGKLEAGRLSVLSGIDMTRQYPAPPSAAQLEATLQLVRVDPLAPGASNDLSALFDAEYRHAGRLEASLEYIVLDPEQREICAARPSSDQLAFEPCERVRSLRDPTGAQHYMRWEEIDRDTTRLAAAATLAIDHPPFDIDAARAHSAIAEGPFGLDIRSSRWILVDEARQRTLLVGERSPVEELPGDWLALLLIWNHAPDVSISWDTGRVPLTDDGMRRLADAGIETEPFRHKGHSTSASFVVTVRREQAQTLAAVLHDLGARLAGLEVVR